MPDLQAMDRVGGVANIVLPAWPARVCSYREAAP
jgi:hypothetical protein